MERVIELDDNLSRRLFTENKYFDFCHWIEWSVHGFPWLISSSLLLLVAYGREWESAIQFGLLVLNLSLYFDLVLIALLKFYVQRERPVKGYGHIMENTMDMYSFPSGHASRAAMLVTILFRFAPKIAIFVSPLPLVVGISRVALGRHYISDVIAGILIGHIEGFLMIQIPYETNLFFRRLLN